MSTCDADDLLDDEPRFAHLLELKLTCSELYLTFDKQRQAFLLTGENDDGVSACLTMTPHDLERTAIELLLAARDRIGRAGPVVKRAWRPSSSQRDRAAWRTVEKVASS